MTAPPPDSLNQAQLDDIQGDVWSRGFPKDFETYYFFTIVPEKGKDLAGCLKTLAEADPPLLSTLRSVSTQREDIEKSRSAFEEAQVAGTVDKGAEAPREEISNALIAFTYKGLETLQGGGPELDPDPLDLELVQGTDVAFRYGMSRDAKAAGSTRAKLNDPDVGTWDPLFKSPDLIHGLLKVAGCNEKLVEAHLGKIQKHLQRGTTIADIQENSLPTLKKSRIDGWTRENHRGKEHFGYQDGISQPLMGPIDKLDGDVDRGRTNMNVEPHILVVTKDTHTNGGARPQWMHNGSFLVVRKLQQDVGAFKQFLQTNLPASGCASVAQLGAKLMGRYQSGAPIASPQHHDHDEGMPNVRNKENNFGYNFEDPSFNPCPISAHIRKTNPRIHFDPQSPDPKGKSVRIIRSGIPYGTDYKDNENDSARGLIFACYQGFLEDSFIRMQGHWSNNKNFTHERPGYDPIIGQAPPAGTNSLTTTITDHTHRRTVEIPTVPKVVTLKGGEYFFVPSMSALKGALAEV